MTRHEVVIPWGAGAYYFKHRWQAWLCRFIMRRWEGWSNWNYMSEFEKARAIKNVSATRNRKKY